MAKSSKSGEKKAPKSDPLADKSDAEKKAALEAAKKADEEAKAKADAEKKAETEAAKAANPAPAKAEKNPSAWAAKAATAAEAKKLGLRHAGMKKPRALAIDKDVKARALELIAEHAELQDKYARARKVHGKGVELKPLRQAVQAKKAELNALYAEAPDSVQAAESEVAAQ